MNTKQTKSNGSKAAQNSTQNKTMNTSRTSSARNCSGKAKNSTQD